MIFAFVIILIVAVLAIHCSQYSKPTAVVFTTIVNDNYAYSITINNDNTAYARVKYANGDIKVYNLHDVADDTPFNDAIVELEANVKTDAFDCMPIFFTSKPGMLYVVTTLDARQEFSDYFVARDYANTMVSTIL